MRRIVLGLVCLGAACSSADSNTISIGEVTRCTAARPPAELPDLVPDAHRQAFFATHPLPRLEYGGGPVLRNPRIVAVFFGDDPLRRQTEALLQSYGCTSAWREGVAEYGVGDALYERSLVLPDFPAVTSLPELEDWMKDQATTLGLGAPGRSFIFFAPAGASYPQQPCTNELGFHTSLALDPSRADAGEVPYAFVERCPSASTTPFDQRALTTTHELLEMAVDPFPSSNPGWFGFDVSHLQLDFPGPENADACNDRHVSTPDYAFPVAAGWSNRRASAGFDPCAPSDRPLAIAYPSQPTLDLSGGSATLDVDFYSDDPAAQYTSFSTAFSSSCVRVESEGGGDSFTSMVRDGTILHLKVTARPDLHCSSIDPRHEDQLLVYLGSPDGFNLMSTLVTLTGLPPPAQ